jgi:hypothetical protein
MATRIKQIAVKNLDSAVLAAVNNLNATKGLKLKGPIINGIIIKPELIKDLKAEAIAKEITAQVSLGVTDMKLTPKVVIGDGILTIGFIAREIPKVIG